MSQSACVPTKANLAPNQLSETTTSRSQRFICMSILRLFTAATAILILLSGCGGGTETASNYQVQSGVAQKGALLQGSEITINEMAWNSFVQNGKSYSFQTLDNFGSFNPSGIQFSSPYLLTTAQGYYFNELTGASSNDIVFLRGLSNIDAEQDSTINVNILTSFSKNRTLSLLNNPISPLKFNDARDQAQKELLENFYIYNHKDLLSGKVNAGVKQPNSFTNLNLSSQRIGDQILAALSGVVMRVTQLGVSLNTFLSEVENDLTDDGLLNATSTLSIVTATTTFANLNATSTQDLFCAAFKSTNFNLIAININKFYRTTYQASDLSQWIDSSGCVDKVIDKFKFTSADGRIGYASRSPNYVATSNDAGQCLTLNSNSESSIIGLYLNNAATASQNNIDQSYYGSAVKASAGDSFSIGITGLRAAAFTAYLQRFSPVNGSCNAIPPKGAMVNLIKYSVISK